MLARGGTGFGHRFSQRQTGIGRGFGSARRARFPRSLTELNAIFTAYGASFAHAWRLEESSGDALDLATTGAINLAPGAAAPFRAVTTDLFDGDKGVQYSQFSSQVLRAPNVSELEITTGYLVTLTTILLPVAPSGTRVAWNKAGSGRWRLQVMAGGSLRFESHDGTTTRNSDIAVNHASGTVFRDVLCVISRSGSPDEQVCISDLGSSTVGTPGANTMAASAKFDLGEGFGSCASQVITFFAWGTTAGTLIADRAKALATWRAFRGA